MAGLFLAGLIAGAINSVAGGGSLISFPGLIAYGIPTIVANATNTAVVWPGTAGSAYAYREDLTRQRVLLFTILVPSIIGGLLGAIILVITPEETFARIVPFLVLFATLLFAASGYFQRWMGAGGPAPVDHGERLSGWRIVWGFAFQLFVATYGGYFGAGIGILMLASMSVMGLHQIHRMNALKALASVFINGIALAYFIVRGLVLWPVAVVMALGAIIGGYGGARLARRVNPRWVRGFIVVVGLLVSVWLFVKA